jgi:hypothetical protein
MPKVSKSGLLSVLSSFDKRLNRKILLIAVGGTAMTLLGIKASTKDIDFNIPNKEDYNDFHALYKKISPGVQIDYYGSNMVFSEALPKDYVKKARGYESGFTNITIKILHPVDIVCSKISRGSDVDMEDIKECIRAYRLKKSDIGNRAKGYSNAGSDALFRKNLRFIIENLFRT